MKIIRNLLLLPVMVLMLGWTGEAVAFSTQSTLTATPNPSNAGQMVTLEATVTAIGDWHWSYACWGWVCFPTYAYTPPLAAPTGTVTFMDGPTSLGTATLAVTSTVASVATLSTTFSTAGSHSLSTSYSGDANNISSDSLPVTQTVNIKQQTSTTLTVQPNYTYSAFGTGWNSGPRLITEYIFQATVSGNSPTGTVTFMDGTEVLGTADLVGGSTGIVLYTLTTGGIHSNLTAVYNGDANNLTSTSPPVSQAVVGYSFTTLTVSPSPSTYSEAVSLTATINESTTFLPTGTVTFTDGANEVGTAPVVSGQATLNTTFNVLGAHSLKANYSGDIYNLSSQSAWISHQVNKSPTTTTLTTSANPSVAGQAVTLAAAITGVSPSGTVNFMDGTVLLGTADVAGGQATLPYTFINVGTHNLTAVYTGDTYNQTSTSPAVAETITIATSSTTLTATPNPVGVGQTLTLTASVNGALPNGTVTFMDGVNTLGTATVSASLATLTTSYPAQGTYNITANYSGDPNNTASTSTPVTLAVKLVSSTALTVTPTSLLAGQYVNLSATVTGTSPTGSVTFKDGPANLGTVTLMAGNATLSAPLTTAGTRSLTAVYDGGADHMPSTSAAVNVSVAADQVTYYHNDVAGTPVATTDSTGALLWKESYRPYGDPMQLPLDANNNIWFTGKPYDTDSGLSYMGARYYDPLIGRFMGMDPVGYQEDNLHSFNRYAYANNNPNKFVDPDGRIAETVWDAANLAIGVASFGSNVASGNYVGAAIDGVGIVIDAAATAVPFVPGGAGMTIKAVRGVDAAVGAAKVTKVASKEITKSSRKRVKRLVKDLSDNSRQNNGLSQEKTDQLRRIVEKAGGKIRNDGTSGVKGSSAGKPHVQTEGLGKSIDSRHIWTKEGVQ